MMAFLFSILTSSPLNVVLPTLIVFFSLIFIYNALQSLFHHFISDGKYCCSSYGPEKHLLIGSLIPFYKNRRRLLGWYTKLLAESPTGTIVVDRLGARRTIITANPENVEYILKTNFNNYPKGKPFTDILGDLLGCGIFNVDGEAWHIRRKLASHEFSTKSLRDFVVKALKSEVHDRLLPILSSSEKKKKVVDMQDFAPAFSI
ncbi:hypothetical protein J5N97_002016 [Dioscorea zingiberensis]|uniref:Cytochrome P450 n=1 Tax=Dioscorea zingiberensis TaxID=325984 RepID=A0A9D5BSR6_9LILI|nr:hypothetical protein J5N97_002016 [Dioscorea zingiberensis]